MTNQLNCPTLCHMRRKDILENRLNAYIPADLHAAVTLLAAQQGRTLRELLIDALQRILSTPTGHSNP